MDFKMDFRSLEGFDKEIAGLRQQSKTGLRTAANQIRDKMRSFVKPSRKGSTGKLARAINVKKISDNKDEISYSVGDMQEMFRKAPYWFVANYGRLWPGSYEDAALGKTGKKFVPGPVVGTFGGQAPKASMKGTGRGKDRFKQAKQGNYIDPTSSTKPIRFIEKTNDWLNVFWDSYWNKQVR